MRRALDHAEVVGGRAWNGALKALPRDSLLIFSQISLGRLLARASVLGIVSSIVLH